MADYRMILTRIWDDAWFSELSPAGKLLWIWAFSNSRVSVSGLYEVPLKTIAFETGISVKETSALLAEFCAAGKAFFEDGVLFVPKILKHQSSSSGTMKARAVADVLKVSDCRLKLMAMSALGMDGVQPADQQLSSQPDTPSVAYGHPTDTNARARADSDSDSETSTDTETQHTSAGAGCRLAPACAVLPISSQTDAAVRTPDTAKCNGAVPYKLLLDCWNECARHVGFPKALDAGPKRKKALAARYHHPAKFPGIVAWLAVLEQIGRDPWWIDAGKEGKGWVGIDAALRADKWEGRVEKGINYLTPERAAQWAADFRAWGDDGYAKLLEDWAEALHRTTAAA